MTFGGEALKEEARCPGFGTLGKTAPTPGSRGLSFPLPSFGRAGVTARGPPAVPTVRWGKGPRVCPQSPRDAAVKGGRLFLERC